MTEKGLRVEQGIDQLVILTLEDDEHLYLCEATETDRGIQELPYNHAIFLEYSSVHFVKQVLTAFAARSDWIIDNSYHTVLPGDQFVERMDRDPKWDWKAELQEKRAMPYPNAP